MLPVLGRPLAGPTPCAVTGTRVVATLERCRRTMQRLMLLRHQSGPECCYLERVHATLRRPV